MKVHGWQIAPTQGAIPFESAIQKAFQEPDKSKHFSDWLTRVELCNEVGDLVEFDMARPLGQDVLIGNDSAPARPIPREPDDKFLTNTAGLYIKSKKILLIQSNVHGVFAGTIINYFSSFCGVPAGYIHDPIGIAASSPADIKNSTITKIVLNANLVRLEKASLLNSSVIANLFRQSRDYSADQVQLVLNCRKKWFGPKEAKTLAHLDDLMIDDLVDFTIGASAVDSRAIKTKFYNRYEKDVTDRLLSLVGKRWSHSEEVRQASTGSLRFPFENRILVVRNAISKLP